jgi:glyoxylase-like metal-dependent hydrolase (beta-lactamase superfamily II)
MHPQANFHFSIGQFQAAVLHDWREDLPGQCLVKNGPPDLDAIFQARALSLQHTRLDYQVLLLQTGQAAFLVDAGIGDADPGQDPELSGKLRAAGLDFLLQPRSAWLLAGLAAEGLRPEDIDAVILTHGDSDHTGGLLTRDQQPVFPKARYYLSGASWRFWSDPAQFGALPFFMNAFGRRVLPVLAEKVQAVEPGFEFLPGIRFYAAEGHRPGHAGLQIDSQVQTLLHTADTFGHELLVAYPEWQGFADANHPQAVLDRQTLINQASQNASLVFGSHLTFPGLGRICLGGERPAWQPLDRPGPD